MCYSRVGGVCGCLGLSWRDKPWNVLVSSCLETGSHVPVLGFVSPGKPFPTLPVQGPHLTVAFRTPTSDSVGGPPNGRTTGLHRCRGPVYDHFNNLCRENAIAVVRAFRQAEPQCALSDHLLAEQQRADYSQMWPGVVFSRCIVWGRVARPDREGGVGRSRPEP